MQLLNNLPNECELENGGVGGKPEEILLSATLANPKVLDGEMDAGVGAAVHHTLPPTKVSSTDVD